MKRSLSQSLNYEHLKWNSSFNTCDSMYNHVEDNRIVMENVQDAKKNIQRDRHSGWSRNEHNLMQHDRINDRQLERHKVIDLQHGKDVSTRHILPRDENNSYGIHTKDYSSATFSVANSHNFDKELNSSEDSTTIQWNRSENKKPTEFSHTTNKDCAISQMDQNVSKSEPSDLSISEEDIPTSCDDSYPNCDSKFHIPIWLFSTYTTIWKKKKFSHICNSALQQRFVDPESPLWCANLLTESTMHQPEIIHKKFVSFYVEFLEELLRQPQLRKMMKSNSIYLNHNIALVLYFIERPMDCIKMLDALLEICDLRNLEAEKYIILQSITYVYIQLKKYYEASLILLHLLKEEFIHFPRYLHSFYLSARLIDSCLEELTHFTFVTNEENEENEEDKNNLGITAGKIENETFESRSKSKKQRYTTIQNYTLLRTLILDVLVKLKPKNQLYNLWRQHWSQMINSSPSDLAIRTSKLALDEFDLLDLTKTVSQTLQEIANLSPCTKVKQRNHFQEPLRTPSQTLQQSNYMTWQYIKNTLSPLKRLYQKGSKMNLSIICLIISLFGFAIVVKALQQWMLSGFFSRFNFIRNKGHKNYLHTKFPMYNQKHSHTSLKQPKYIQSFGNNFIERKYPNGDHISHFNVFGCFREK